MLRANTDHAIPCIAYNSVKSVSADQSETNTWAKAIGQARERGRECTYTKRVYSVARKRNFYIIILPLTSETVLESLLLIFRVLRHGDLYRAEFIVLLGLSQGKSRAR